MHTPPPGHREHGATTKKTQKQVRRLSSWAGVWRFLFVLSRVGFTPFFRSAIPCPVQGSLMGHVFINLGYCGNNFIVFLRIVRCCILNTSDV